MDYKSILKECIKIIENEGWKLPENIKIKSVKNYFKDKPFSPSYVDRDTNTVCIMTSIVDKDTIKILTIHELLHLINKKDYSHGNDFKKKTNILNKKYKLNIPYAAEDLLDKKETFKKNPDLKRQAYKIFANNAKKPIKKLVDKVVYKEIPSKVIKESYFNY